MKKTLTLLILICLNLFFSWNAFSIQRFPKPEFESGYTQPDTLMPSARAEILAYMDVAVLILALSFISWLVLKKRSRKGVFWTSMFSLIYFGFYREGCVCSIGAIQNVSLALFDSSYTLPVTALAFFAIPLIFTLFVGRTFCAGICPFGAMQDLVAFKPMSIGVRLNAILGLLPYLYLALSILYAATGTDFIICRYDPFVGIFRMNASFGMFVFAGGLLISGIFIARPYCRFLCPYGVLLNWFSRYSRRHMTITPAHCIQCRLCEGSCPYDAIEIPVTETKNHDNTKQRLKRLIMMSFIIPLLMVVGGYTGYLLHETLAGVHSKVRLANQVINTEVSPLKAETFEIQAYKSSGKTQAQVLKEAGIVLSKFKKGSIILGGFIGLLFGLLIAGKLLKRHNPDYIPHKGRCFSCARCIDYCPVKAEN
ncbi:MAG: 4Fe-4S binding protein [Bacteroidales bacterium]|nr:4Fe-4S binding protein [Bacteroidales bacterium]